MDEEKFFVPFINTIILFAKLVMPIVDRYKTHKNLLTRHRAPVYILDEFLILLSIDSIFVWNFDLPINYLYYWSQRNEEL